MTFDEFTDLATVLFLILLYTVVFINQFLLK